MVVDVLLSPKVGRIEKTDSSCKQVLRDSDEKVKLNIGGEFFEAQVAHLKRYPKTMFARMVDQIWSKDLGSRVIFIDRSPKYFKLIMDFIVNGSVQLPRSRIELDEIEQEAEFYQLDELITVILRKDRRCFGEGPPFFPKDRVVWKTRNFWRQMLARGWRFDGNKEQLPLCFTHFTLFSPNEICYLCGVETKDLNGLYKCLFDFPRDFSFTVGEIDKIYGDSCCCDVRFGKSSFIFHIPTTLLRLAD
uniref:BTB domain-containing protein n=1 Tax=Haemonchus contortus TaxID=6289 RepID=A0A7I4YEN2_HAECO|nr:Potassium channel domain containing protein [Haemonchus contortus]